ncbi:unnamed protein product, partial [Ectocarpus sp. 12 AP-2014]
QQQQTQQLTHNKQEDFSPASLGMPFSSSAYSPSWDSSFPAPLPPISTTGRQRSPSFGRLTPQLQQQQQRTVVTPDRTAVATPPGVGVGVGVSRASQEQRLSPGAFSRQQQQQQLSGVTSEDVREARSCSSDAVERSPNQCTRLSRQASLPAGLGAVGSGAISHSFPLEAALCDGTNLSSIGGDSSSATFVMPDAAALGQGGWGGSWDMATAAAVCTATG